MSIVPEDHIRFFKLAASFHKHAAGPVDEDVRYARISYERLDGSKPEGLVLDFEDDLIPLPTAERCLLLGEHLLDELPDLLLNVTAWRTSTFASSIRSIKWRWMRFFNS